MSPSGNGCGVSRYESGRPKFESSRFVSQPTLRFCRFLTTQRESSRREGLPTSLVCLKRAGDTGVTLKHGDVSPCCEHNRAQTCAHVGPKQAALATFRNGSRATPIEMRVELPLLT